MRRLMARVRSWGSEEESWGEWMRTVSEEVAKAREGLWPVEAAHGDQAGAGRPDPG